jgi:asparagine synthase (glutamine-hydrolysing)
MMYFFDIDKPAAYGEALRPFLARSTLGLLDRYFAEAPNFVSGASWADIHTYLPDDILVKVDVASMAWGLEARAPFLDVELMELASSIPDRQKLRGGVLKGLLKDALRPILPDEVLDRPKMGFGVPIETWFRKELRDFSRDVLGSPASRGRGLFRDGYALGLLDAHAAGRRLNHTRLWALVMLELWFRTWIDAPSVPRSVTRAAQRAPSLSSESTAKE